MKINEKNIDTNSNQLSISDRDRLWVEENFKWLKTVFGYPNRLEEQVLFTSKFFPNSFQEGPIKIKNLFTDLCALFGLSRDSTRYELVGDLRRSPSRNNAGDNQLPCESRLEKGDYVIFVQRQLLEHKERLLVCLVYEFIRIRLDESDLEHDVGGDDTQLFVYLAGIYYGFGVIIAQHFYHLQDADNSSSEINWSYHPEMPPAVLAFSLATYANLRGEDDPKWKSELHPDFRKMVEDGIVYLKVNPNGLYDHREAKANDLFNEANDHFDNNDLEAAISALQKILFITDDEVMKADVYNNMGYYYLRKQDYQQGISNFRKALVVGPEYGFANDNLGYALIMTGELDEGFSYVTKAMATGNSDLAYTYRNFGLYHQRKKDSVLAEEFFQKAFNEKTPVDLLEYHYAEFLLEQGDYQRAKYYLQKSVDKGEREGISRLEQLRSSSGPIVLR